VALPITAPDGSEGEERMKTLVLVTGLAVLVALSTLSPGMAMAQWGGRWRDRWGGQGYSQDPSYQSPGYGYRSPGYGAPGGYGGQGGYGAPEGYPSSGYPPPGYAQPPPYQPPYAYPSQGQSPQQVTTDQSECGTWATQQSGYNPSQPGTAAWAASSGSGPLGTLNIGQRFPGLFGGIQRREERREARRERWYEDNQTYAGQQQNSYNRALDSCLTARGYTVR